MPVLIQKVLNVSFGTQMETRDLASVMGSLGDRMSAFEEVKHRLCSREERKRLVEKLKEVNNSAMESWKDCISLLRVVRWYALTTAERQNQRIFL